MDGRYFTFRTVGLSLLISGIAAADWLTPAAVVVGILFCVPILLSSMGDDARLVFTIVGVCVTAFIVAATFGSGPITPDAIWLPNRVFALVTIVASGPIALLLQRRRLAAEAERELNALLRSLMAHDLRSPLALARDAIASVGTATADRVVDHDLLADVDARLRRSLRSIDLVLTAARADIEPGPRQTRAGLTDPAAELHDELSAFEMEAASRGKTLVSDLPESPSGVRVDVPVLRQAVAILVDNAVRHAVAGPIRVTLALDTDHLRVTVRDQGPGLSSTAAGGPAGAGLGIRLCELLARSAGGSLDVTRDGPDGSEFRLRLPTSP